MMCIYAWYKEEEKDDAKKREREEETQGAAHASSSSSLSVICHSPTITIINPHIIISITSSSPSITSHHTRSMIFLRKRSTQQHTAPCSTAQHRAAPRSTTQHHTTYHAIRYTLYATRNTQHATRSTQHATRSTQHAQVRTTSLPDLLFMFHSLFSPHIQING